VDCPELGRPLAAAARRFTAAFLTGGELRIEPTDARRDRYGRLLGDVLVEGRSLSEGLLERGLAWVYRSRDERLLALQRAAVEARAGIHGRPSRASGERFLVTTSSFHGVHCPTVRRRARSLPIACDPAGLFKRGLAPCRSCLSWPPGWGDG